ncbi:MAG: hypothetical protein JWP27_917 [Flaviaesturariibacter sp.]|nr:hypothetical protein [Flaviaesturariibacter sp.]
MNRHLIFIPRLVDIVFTLPAKRLWLDLLLFAIYLALFCWLVTRVPFFRKSGLGPILLAILFLLKVIASMLYGWQGLRYSYLIQMGDTWIWHFSSLKGLPLLKFNPLAFLADLPRPYQHGYGGFLSSRSSWWNDLHKAMFVKLLTIFNLFSGSNYYINTVFYSFLTFFGPVALYRTALHAFGGRRWWLVAGTFLIPSFLYWGSGIHKDGLAFLGVALLVYEVYFWVKQRSIGWQGIVAALSGCLLLLMYRNYLLVVLLPALLVWMMAERIGRKPWLVFLVSYTVFGFAFFTLPLLSPRLDLPRAVVEKQEDFLTLKANSYVPVKKLEPTAASFLRTAPYALELTVLRPFPSDAKHLFSLAAALENGALLLLLVASLVWRRPGPPNAFFWFCLFFSLSVFLVIGYTVNFLGAIVRYRSVVLPFIVLPLLSGFDLARFPKLYNK